MGLWINWILKNTRITGKSFFNPLTPNVPHHIETNQLICSSNQLTGFYTMGIIGRLWVKYNSENKTI